MRVYLCERGCEHACEERTCRTCARWTQSVVAIDHYCAWHRHVTNPEDFCSRWRGRHDC